MQQHQKHTILEIRSLKEIDPSLVQPVISIPDFSTPTASQHPIVISSNSKYFCIDGFQKIIETREKGLDLIKCVFLEVEAVNQTEAAIRKVASRVKTSGGSASFGELVRAIVFLHRLLKSSETDLINYSHGGCRRGEKYQGRRDVVSLIANRLGKQRKWVQRLLHFGKYLDDDTLNLLANEKSPKSFFEKIQHKKGSKIAELIGKEHTENDISIWVSHLIRQLWSQRDIEENNSEHQPREDQSEDVACSDSPAVPSSNDTATENSEEGFETPSTSKITTVASAQRILKEIGDDYSRLNTTTFNSIHDFKEALEPLIQQVNELWIDVVSLCHSTESQADDEVSKDG